MTERIEAQPPVLDLQQLRIWMKLLGDTLRMHIYDLDGNLVASGPGDVDSLKFSCRMLCNAHRLGAWRIVAGSECLYKASWGSKGSSQHSDFFAGQSIEVTLE